MEYVISAFAVEKEATDLVNISENVGWGII